MMCAYPTCASCWANSACAWCNGTCVLGTCALSTCSAEPDVVAAAIQYLSMVLFILSMLPLCMLAYGLYTHVRERVAVAPLDAQAARV